MILKVKERVLKRNLGLYWRGVDLIEVNPNQTPQEWLDSVIHEALHFTFPKKKEKAIKRAATVLADMLWLLGYRRPARKRPVKLKVRVRKSGHLEGGMT